MDKESSILDAVKRIPMIWAHKHYDDESVKVYDVQFEDVCETCRERVAIAIDEGHICAIHKLPKEWADAGEPFMCEFCYEKKHRPL